MKATFSEFSFGYALTQEIAALFKSRLGQAPIFPSQVEEGREGGGYDVKFDFGYPLFLQFKLSEHMVHPNAFEWCLFNEKYYRFKIWAKRNSAQHELLLDLEDDHDLVFYAAPAFRDVEQLNNAYFGRDVSECCAFVSPQEIGRFDDDGQHRVVFNQDLSDAYACSKEREIDVIAGGEEFVELVSENMFELEPRAVNEETFQQITDDLLGRLRGLGQIAKRREDLGVASDAIDGLRGMSEASQAAYIARVFYQCELMILPRPTNT